VRIWISSIQYRGHVALKLPNPQWLPGSLSSLSLILILL
jgi:hypothetical protein